jgi:hypothetical protein
MGGSTRTERALGSWPAVLTSPLCHLQPPFLLFLLLFCFEDLQFPLQLPLSFQFPPRRRGLLPLWPPCPLPFTLLVPFALPLPALLSFPQPRQATLCWWLP